MDVFSNIVELLLLLCNNSIYKVTPFLLTNIWFSQVFWIISRKATYLMVWGMITQIFRIRQTSCDFVSYSILISQSSFSIDFPCYFYKTKLKTEAVVWTCSIKKVFLSACLKACLRPATLLKKSLCHRCFPVNFAKFLRTSCFSEHLRWLLL